MYWHNGVVVVMGDFNAHLQGNVFIKPADDRGRYLIDMMDSFNLVSQNSLSMYSGASASFVPYDVAYTSLIDHILLPVERIETVISCKILDDHVLNVSRHRPIVYSISVPLADFINAPNTFSSHIKWDKLDPGILQLYSSELSSLLSSHFFKVDFNAKDKLDQTYTNIINSITAASDLILPRTKFKPYLKPCWDFTLKDFHAAMREKRRQWNRANRPRGNRHSSYKDYKSAKCLFRAHHRRCADNFLTEINIDIDQAAKVDSALFWKKLNCRKKFLNTEAGCETKCGTTVSRDPEHIVSGWGIILKICILTLSDLIMNQIFSGK